MNKKVLIIDDNPDVLDIMQQLIDSILQALSIEAEISEAGSSEEAFSLLKDNSFDFVFSDLQCDLKDKNAKPGFQIVKVAKEKKPSCCTFVITGLKVDENLKREGIGSDVDGYIQKPAMVPEIMSAIKAALEKQQEV